MDLPSQLLATNWTVDPFGLRRLCEALQAKIAAGETADLLPPNPHDGKEAERRYSSIFLRLQKTIQGSDSAFAAVAAGMAVKWMKGMPYPVLLAGEILKERKRREKKLVLYHEELQNNPRSRKRMPKPVNVNAVVRRTFDMIEDIVRFRYVQWGKAYIDVLSFVLREAGQEEHIDAIFDFPLALELGLATRSGWSFMELGLSRIAASALEPHFPNSNLNVQQARLWLATTNVQSFRLSRVIEDELARLGLTKIAV